MFFFRETIKKTERKTKKNREMIMKIFLTKKIILFEMFESRPTGKRKIHYLFKNYFMFSYSKKRVVRF